MMKVTVSIANNQKIDIGVNPKQVIKDTFKILQEKGICMLVERAYIVIPRLQQRVSVLATYEEAGIIEGDILSI